MMMMMHGKKENGREIPLLHIREKEKVPMEKDFSNAVPVKASLYAFPCRRKKDTFFFPGYNGVERYTVDDMVL